jgi:hypothetical protein
VKLRKDHRRHKLASLVRSTWNHGLRTGNADIHTAHRITPTDVEACAVLP